MNLIHPTAIIDPSASIGHQTQIGAYSIVGPGVTIGAECEIGPHVVIQGPTTMGRGNRIYQFASIGANPQDKKYAGEETKLLIGDNNVFREFVTINRGTTQDQGFTRIGNGNWIMAYVHIAHDCKVGNNTIFSNSASLAGHVTVDDMASLGGFTLVHQFCHIGAHCFTGMNSVISKDVPPYLLVSGHMAVPHGLNAEGLKRRGFSPECLLLLRKAYKTVYRSGLTLQAACTEIGSWQSGDPHVERFVEFLLSSTRGIIR